MNIKLHLVAPAMIALLVTAARADIYFSDNFEAEDIGSTLSKWTKSVSTGNSVSIVSAPAIGNRSARFVDTGGTGWQPQIQGNFASVTGAIQIDFDWYMNTTVATADQALQFSLRDGVKNLRQVIITIGGPDGLTINGTAYATEIVSGQWNHLTVTSDPVGTANGKIKVTLKQGDIVKTITDIPYRFTGLSGYDSMLFQLGEKVAGAGVEAYIDNVTVQSPVPEPASVGVLGALGVSILLWRRKA